MDTTVTLLCTRCKLTLPSDRFIPARKKNKRTGWCKDCVNEYNRSRRLIKRAKVEADRQALIDAGKKVCVQCSQTLSFSEFHMDKRRRDGHFPYCKPCRYVRDGRIPRRPPAFATKADYDRDRQKKMGPGSHRRNYLMTQYRMTLEDYETLFHAQDGKCAICHQPETGTMGKHGTGKSLAVDHDHSCCPGKTSCGQCVRALLCGRCNTAIGLLGDDYERVQAAALYLLNSTTIGEQLRLLG